MVQGKSPKKVERDDEVDDQCVDKSKKSGEDEMVQTHEESFIIGTLQINVARVEETIYTKIKWEINKFL